MKNKGDLAPPESARWTQPGDYLSALARRRTERMKREPRLRRTQPEVPRLLLSTLPFLLLLGALAILAAAIIIVAWPGSQPSPRPRPVEHRQGVASKGWFQEAQREMAR